MPKKTSRSFFGSFFWAMFCTHFTISRQGFHWDWPLSRCERKQRLQLAENRLQALEGQELLEEMVQEPGGALVLESDEFFQILEKSIVRLSLKHTLTTS